MYTLRFGRDANVLPSCTLTHSRMALSLVSSSLGSCTCLPRMPLIPRDPSRHDFPEHQLPEISKSQPKLNKNFVPRSWLTRIVLHANRKRFWGKMREKKRNFPTQNKSECHHYILQNHKINKIQPKNWLSSNVQVKKKWSNPGKKKEFSLVKTPKKLLEVYCVKS